MKSIEKMLHGELEINEFLALAEASDSLKNALNNLIPEDAKSDENHIFWKKIKSPRIVYEQFNFDVYRLVESLVMPKNKIGTNVNVYETIKHLYAVSHPDFPFITRYTDQSLMYLSVVKDIYDGPEVSDVLIKIFDKAFESNGKTARITIAKNEIKATFHLENKKYPRWTQGAEWPMGKESPMKFISQKRIGELTEYTFQDVDTNEIRIVKQYY